MKIVQSHFLIVSKMNISINNWNISFFKENNSLWKIFAIAACLQHSTCLQNNLFAWPIANLFNSAKRTNGVKYSSGFFCVRASMFVSRRKFMAFAMYLKSIKVETRLNLFLHLNNFSCSTLRLQFYQLEAIFMYFGIIKFP